MSRAFSLGLGPTDRPLEEALRIRGLAGGRDTNGLDATRSLQGARRSRSSAYPIPIRGVARTSAAGTGVPSSTKR
ncbi:MAG TPA: hypothetical protein VMT52_16730, partial [Planctomycetota bacterium]|nr:hypothetical protein [Planctomycetota bacterium]